LRQHNFPRSGAGAFTKPVLLLVDEMSASAAGIFLIDRNSLPL